MSSFISFLEFHIALSEILLTACADQLLYNLKRSRKDCKRQLFIVSKIDIICYIRTTPQFINYQLERSYKIFLSLKYLFHFEIYISHFLPVVDCTFLLLKSKFMEIKPFEHSSCCRLLDSYFNENVLRQRGLDKNF